MTESQADTKQPIWLTSAIAGFTFLIMWVTYHTTHLRWGWGLGWSLLAAFVLMIPVGFAIDRWLKSKY